MTNNGLALREPLAPPDIDFDAEQHWITILHPAYPDDKNCLFTFEACDHPEGGLHKVVVLTACGIIAGNFWNGYLSTSRDGPPIDEDIYVLREPSYYFHALPYSSATIPNVASAPTPQYIASPTATARPLTAPTRPSPHLYPIYTDFRDWPFPHRNLPPWWPKIPRARHAFSSQPYSKLTDAVRQRDESCRLTGWGQITEGAHIVPREESDWFGENGMKAYSSSTLLPSPDNSANVFLLRRDVYSAYDRSIWTIVPKKLDSTSAEAPWVFHLLDNDEEYKAAFHNVKLRPLSGINSEYLLAGFALVIFPMLQSFLGNSAEKHLIGKSITEIPRGRLVDGRECGKRFPSNKYRTRSPRKKGARGEEELSDQAWNQRLSDLCPDNRFGPARQHERKRPRLTSSGSTQHSVEKADILPMQHADMPSALLSLQPQLPTVSFACQCPSPICKPDINPVGQNGAETEEPEAEVVGDICCAHECRTWMDLERLESLRQKALEHERRRLPSHVGEWWHCQVEWAQEKAQDTFAGRDHEQVMWVQGEEVVDGKTGDYFESTEDFLRLFGPWTTATYSDDGLGEDLHADEGFFELDYPFPIATSVQESSSDLVSHENMVKVEDGKHYIHQGV
ncbi:MAG: hypothetical protein Q9170_008109 [Blastenia crenularia]